MTQNESHPAISSDIDLDMRVLCTLDSDGDSVRNGAVLLVANRDTLIRLAAKEAEAGNPGRWIVAEGGCPEWRMVWGDDNPTAGDLLAFGQADGGQARDTDFSVLRTYGGWLVSVHTPVVVFQFDPEPETAPAQNAVDALPDAIQRFTQDGQKTYDRSQDAVEANPGVPVYRVSDGDSNWYVSWTGSVEELKAAEAKRVASEVSSGTYGEDRWQTFDLYFFLVADLDEYCGEIEVDTSHKRPDGLVELKAILEEVAAAPGGDLDVHLFWSDERQYTNRLPSFEVSNMPRGTERAECLSFDDTHVLVNPRGGVFEIVEYSAWNVTHDIMSEHEARA